MSKIFKNDYIKYKGESAFPFVELIEKLCVIPNVEISYIVLDYEEDGSFSKSYKVDDFLKLIEEANYFADEFTILGTIYRDEQNKKIDKNSRIMITTKGDNKIDVMCSYKNLLLLSNILKTNLKKGEK